MRFIYLLAILLVVFQNTIAQNRAKQDSTVFVTTGSPIKISYFGDNLGVKPGFSIGLQHTFRTCEIEKIKKSGKTKLMSRNFFYSLNLSYYQHKGYNSALYLYPEIGYRKIKNSGFYSEVSVGAGLFHTFLSGPTYTVDDSGSVNKIAAAGSNNLAFHFSPGFGWDFSKPKPSLPLQIFIKPNLLFQYPYNGLFLKHIIIETGVNYSFSNFMPRHTKTIYRKK
jgi:hypothetical protein